MNTARNGLSRGQATRRTARRFNGLACSSASNDGIRRQFQPAGQLVISRQVGSPFGLIEATAFGSRMWPATGISSLGHRLHTAFPILWISRLCVGRACPLETSAMYRVPSEIAERFGLIELSQEEAQVAAYEMRDGG